MVTGAHRLLLRLWGRVPRALRVRVVRLAAPSYTVGGECVIDRGDGSILLVRLSYRRGWGLPGGLIQRREDVAVCARREVGEEVGLDVELVGPPAVVVDSDPQRIDVVFRARPAAGADPDAARPTSPEIVEVRWFPAGDLPTLQPEAIAALEALATRARHGAPAGASPAPDGEAGGSSPGAGDDASGAIGPARDNGDDVVRLAAAQAARQRAAGR